MSKLLLFAGAALGGTILLGIILANRSESPSPPGDEDDELPRLRQRAIDALNEVVPSSYGSQKFAKLAPGYTPEILKKYPTFTTCGYLPSFVARRLGGTGKILQAGLALMREVGIERKAWRTLKDGLPRPGDFYALVDDNDGIVHVGVVRSANQTSWETADAGQGPKDAQRAENITRIFNPIEGTVTYSGKTRRVGGWIDIEAFGFPDGTVVA